MNRRAPLALGFLALLALSGTSQTTLQIPPGPVTPGVPFNVILTNNTTICIDAFAGNILTLLQPGGELIAPVLVGCGPVAMCLSNGAKATLSYTAPATGPGSSGSFLLLCPHGSGAAARLDVGSASPLFPDIHTYPTRFPHGPGGHHIAVPVPGSEWEFSNTAAQARVISALIRIYAPGGTTPVASRTFGALTVPANGVARVSLPLSGLGVGPYTVQVNWIDPVAGAVTVRHGIELSAGTSVDLHLPGGGMLPVNGSITARLAVTQSSPRAPAAWPYVLAVGYLPGTTMFPGGVIVPLAPDPLVIASVVHGIGGLVTNNVGTTTSASVYCAHGLTYYPVASNIGIRHPGPVLSGLRLRLGAVAMTPGSGPWVASQPEEITLQ